MLHAAELQAKDYTEEVLYLRFEAWKLNDIKFLKSQKFPGPFAISWGSVIHGCYSRIKREERTNVLWSKVPKKQFHTHEKGCRSFPIETCTQNFETIDYATNLCQYLDQTNSISSILMGDLRNVLNGCNSIVEVDTTSTDQNEVTKEVSKEEVITK